MVGSRLERALARVEVVSMSPQKEDGYTPIANELLEAFYRCKMEEYERCVVMCIWRKTYGWSKKEDWVSLSQLNTETGIAIPNISRTIKQLISKGVVVKNGKRISVNKKWKEWQIEWRIDMKKLSHQITKVISPDNKKLSHQITTKTKSKNKTNSEANASADNMIWNKHSDDFEEGYVDLDGDISLNSIKKRPARKYPNAPAVRKVFQEVLGKNPANWKVNATQLQACENLFTERGIEKIRKALEFYQENKQKEYCPQITSPYDLDSKWTKLGEFKLKQT